MMRTRTLFLLVAVACMVASTSVSAQVAAKPRAPKAAALRATNRGKKDGHIR